MNIQELSQEQFLTRNRCTEGDLVAAQISWEDLRAIGVEHAKNTPLLKSAVHPVANMLQEFESIHSVRWRIKDPEHLMEKVLRKRKAFFTKEKPDKGLEKYTDISTTNYSEIVTDLVGVRALYLFKSDIVPVNDFIRENWKLLKGERPTLYYRENDPIPNKEGLKKLRLTSKQHPMSYRSVHYVIKTEPTVKPVIIEIQARTIYEEAWSEINHRIVYPNHSDDSKLKNFLTILNRLSGSADEMGTFVHDLKNYISDTEKQIILLEQERESKKTEIKMLANKIKKQDSKGRKVENVDSNVDELLLKINELDSKPRSTTVAGLESIGFNHYLAENDLARYALENNEFASEILYDAMDPNLLTLSQLASINNPTALKFSNEGILDAIKEEEHRASSLLSISGAPNNKE